MLFSFFETTTFGLFLITLAICGSVLSASGVGQKLFIMS
jgi:hypothetical protein